MFGKKIKKVLVVDGMMCEHCKAKVENALSKIENVDKIKVNLKSKMVEIYSSRSIDNDVIKNVIDNLGYKIVEIGEEK